MRRRRQTFWVGATAVIIVYVAAVVWVFTRSAPLVSHRPITLRVSHWQLEKGTPEGFAAVIKRYEELNPRVHVEQVIVPGSIYRQWLRSNLGGGMGTDIVEFGYYMGGITDIPPRYFEPITALMAQPNPYNRGTPLEHMAWQKTFVDGLYYTIAESQQIGQIYAVTMGQGGMRMFCNRNLLEKITGRPVTPPKTMEDFRKLCADINAYRERTGVVVHPLAGSDSNSKWLMEFLMIGSVARMNLELDDEGMLVRSARSTMVDYLRNRWDYRRPELQAALSLVRETMLQMKPGFSQLSRDDAIQQFMRGEAVFIYTGPWDATQLTTSASFPVEVMYFPQPDEHDPVVGRYLAGKFQDGTRATGLSLYLNRNSRHKQEAIDFLHFITSMEGGKLFSDAARGISSIRGVKALPDVEIYRPDGSGYHTGIFYMSVGNANSMLTFNQKLHLLFSHEGGVKAFTDAVESRLRPEVVADLQLEARANTTNVRGVEGEIAALSALHRLSPNQPDDDRVQVLVTNQTLNELGKYESAWAVQHWSK